jgi:hypothetical protein
MSMMYNDPSMTGQTQNVAGNASTQGLLAWLAHLSQGIAKTVGVDNPKRPVTKPPRVNFTGNPNQPTSKDNDMLGVTMGGGGAGGTSVGGGVGGTGGNLELSVRNALQARSDRNTGPVTVDQVNTGVALANSLQGYNAMQGGGSPYDSLGEGIKNAVQAYQNRPQNLGNLGSSASQGSDMSSLGSNYYSTGGGKTVGDVADIGGGAGSKLGNYGAIVGSMLSSLAKSIGSSSYQYQPIQAPVVQNPYIQGLTLNRG